jgi:hypothetical protein
MDSIIELPVSDECVSAFMIIDRRMTMVCFIPFNDGKKKAMDLFKLFMKGISRLHDLPSNIVSDHDC